MACLACVALVALAAARTAGADDSGCFVSCLGRDTTSIECYRRTGRRLQVEQVDRAGRVLTRRLVYDFANGVITHMAMVAVSAGGGDTLQAYEGTFTRDSALALLREGRAAPRASRAAVPAGATVA